MKKTIFILLMMFGFFISFGKDKGPKIEVINDTVFIEGKSICLFEKTKANGLRSFYLKDLENNKIAFFQELENYRHFENYNYYYEITFIKSISKAEIPADGKPKTTIKYLIDYGLIADGKITDESEKEFVLIVGQKYSQK